MTRGVAWAAAACWIATAGPVLAQLPNTPPRLVQPDVPMMLMVGTEPSPSQRPAAPLAPLELHKLRQAQSYREGRLFDRARTTLNELLAAAPHHPWVVTELGRLDVAQEDWAGVVRLARAERESQRDSVVLCRELAIAYEKTKKTREATLVVLEAWMAAPGEADWARSTLLHLASIEPKAVREMTQHVADHAPHRADLLIGLAQLHWQMGDGKTALRVVDAADHAAQGIAARVGFADDLLERATAQDSAGAIDALLDIASDPAVEVGLRLAYAQRALTLYAARRDEAGGAPRLFQALNDVPAARWPGDILAAVVRGLRQAGRTNDARALLANRGKAAALPAELSLERALSDLRDGPPERALPALKEAAAGTPEAAFYFAEALFFAGMGDSALSAYKNVSQDPHGAYTGAALERMYLIEDAEPKSALPHLGRIAYEAWRGDNKRAVALAESLYRALPRGPLWSEAAYQLAVLRESAGDARGALEPLLAIADSLPDDRLASRARQRAGDIYLNRFKDEAKAAAQYEECLARYPRAWNAPEIRRKLEALRRDRRL